MTKINSKYISAIDKKMAEYNRTHKRTKSQQFEHDKYERIYEKRDHSCAKEEKSGINWD
jgi:hypothetical protein